MVGLAGGGSSLLADGAADVHWRRRRDHDWEVFIKRIEDKVSVTRFELDLVRKLENSEDWRHGEEELVCGEAHREKLVEFTEEELERGDHWERWHEHRREPQGRQSVVASSSSTDWRSTGGFVVWRGQVWTLQNLLVLLIGFMLKQRPVGDWFNEEVPHKTWRSVGKRWLGDRDAVEVLLAEGLSWRQFVPTVHVTWAEAAVSLAVRDSRVVAVSIEVESSGQWCELRAQAGNSPMVSAGLVRRLGLVQAAGDAVSLRLKGGTWDSVVRCSVRPGVVERLWLPVSWDVGWTVEPELKAPTVTDGKLDWGQDEEWGPLSKPDEYTVQIWWAGHSVGRTHGSLLLGGVIGGWRPLRIGAT